MDCNWKIKDRFNAFEIASGKLCNAAPFTATGITAWCVEADDSDGCERKFSLRVWRIEKLEGEQKKKTAG